MVYLMGVGVLVVIVGMVLMTGSTFRIRSDLGGPMRRVRGGLAVTAVGVLTLGIGVYGGSGSGLTASGPFSAVPHFPYEPSGDNGRGAVVGGRGEVPSDLPNPGFELYLDTDPLAPADDRSAPRPYATLARYAYHNRPVSELASHVGRYARLWTGSEGPHEGRIVSAGKRTLMLESAYRGGWAVYEFERARLTAAEIFVPATEPLRGSAIR